MTARKEAQPEILRDVGILIFVHHHIAEPALVLIQHVLMGLENRDHVQQEVAKIDGIQFQQTPLILVVEVNRFAIKGSGLAGRNLIRRPCAVFPAINDPRQHPWRPAFGINVIRLDQLLEQADLIIGIEDREIRFQVQRRAPFDQGIAVIHPD